MVYPPSSYRASTAAASARARPYGNKYGNTGRQTPTSIRVKARHNVPSRTAAQYTQRHHARAGTAGSSTRGSTRGTRQGPPPSSRTGKTPGYGKSRSGNAGLTKSITVGQYQVGKAIGQGTFGKVKLGTHTMTAEKVAIKVLQKSKIKEAADVERVSREIAILKKVNHDQVIRLFEVIDTPQAIYLIMEFCEGGELFDYIVKHTRIKESVAVRFFHQIIDGIDYLHKVNVIHRDLKPENLLMQRRPEGWHIKVVDFGLSNTNEGNRLLKTACGSPCYAAPEMIAGKKYVGPLADLWSVGVILFAMVCGYLPFEDNSTSQLYKKILRGAYKAPKFISTQVHDLIARILNTEPTQRFTVKDIRRHPWMQQATTTGGAKKASAAVPAKADAVSAAAKTTAAHTIVNAGARGGPEVAERQKQRDAVLADIDETILRQMADLGFNAAQVIDSLATGKHNQITTAYQLLVTRRQKIAAAKARAQEENAAKARAAEVEMERRKAAAAEAAANAAPPKYLPVHPPARTGEVSAAAAAIAAVKSPAVRSAAVAQPPQPAAAAAVPGPTGKEDSVRPAASPPKRPTQPAPPKKQNLAIVGEGTAATRGGRRIVAAPKQEGRARPAPPSTRPPASKQVAKVEQGVSLAPLTGGAVQPPQQNAHPAPTKKDPIEEMKVFHGVFDPMNTSTKAPADIFSDMKRVLATHRVPFAAAAGGGYSITCQSNDCRWKMEICKLEDVKKVYIVRRVRLAGETYAYEAASKRIMEQLRL
jgi:tRNA A-37 threonylcarbamoyl transferase component Bud32